MDDISQWNDNCETYVLFDILGKKWTIFILYLVQHGHQSFNDILKILTKMNSKVLSERLKQLERIGLIKIEIDESNNRNTYHLTQKGLHVSDQIGKLASPHADELVSKKQI